MHTKVEEKTMIDQIFFKLKDGVLKAITKVIEQIVMDFGFADSTAKPKSYYIYNN